MWQGDAACDQCDKTCRTEYSLRKHRREVHNTMGGDREVVGEVFEENNDDLRSMTLGGGMSLASSINNICWVNIKEDGENIDGHTDILEKDYSGRDKLVKTQNNKGMGCCGGAVSLLSWIFGDFRMRHLIWIKLVFLCQSASMTVLYPYINLHMKSLGMTIQETAVVNAVIPVLFIFTPPLAGFLADRIGNFRILLSLLTAAGRGDDFYQLWLYVPCRWSCVHASASDPHGAGHLPLPRQADLGPHVWTPRIQGSVPEPYAAWLL